MGEINWKAKLEPIEEVNIKIYDRIRGLNHNFEGKKWTYLRNNRYGSLHPGLENEKNQARLSIWEDKIENNGGRWGER